MTDPSHWVLCCVKWQPQAEAVSSPKHRVRAVCIPRGHSGLKFGLLGGVLTVCVRLTQRKHFIFRQITENPAEILTPLPPVGWEFPASSYWMFFLVFGTTLAVAVVSFVLHCFVPSGHRKVWLPSLSHAVNICPKQQRFLSQDGTKLISHDLRWFFTAFSHSTLSEIVPLERWGLSWLLPHHYTTHMFFPSCLASIFLRPIFNVDFMSILCHLHLIQLAVIFPIFPELWSQKFSSLKHIRALHRRIFPV